MKTFFVLILFYSVSLAQKGVWVNTSQGLIRLGAAPDSTVLVIAANAVVDSSIYLKRWIFVRDSIYRATQEQARILYSDTGAAAKIMTKEQTRTGYGGKIGVLGYSLGDTAAFTTTATRVSIYVAGARDNQIWQATPRIVANTGLPVAGDFLAVSPKWDSLIVKRAVGTTSGLKFNYFRVK